LNVLRPAAIGLRCLPFYLLTCFLAAGCAHPGSATATVPPATQAGAPAPAGWVDTQLYFGLGPADHPEQGVSETKWREFLDKEVTPRFPDGLSVLEVYGQWRGAAETATERERSKLLIIVYPDNAENRAKIEAIRGAWKRRTGDESVLKVTQPADVSF
jgi:Protein of unknown function (DUF3574)